MRGLCGPDKAHRPGCPPRSRSIKPAAAVLNQRGGHGDAPPVRSPWLASGKPRTPCRTIGKPQAGPVPEAAPPNQEGAPPAPHAPPQ